MSEALYVVGDSLTVLRALPSASVDLIVTSPPFLALRSYLPAGHPDKAREIGQEATPAAFIDVLLDLTEEWARVLTPHGSLCVELGDTYSGSGGAGGDYAEGGLREGQQEFSGSAKKRAQVGVGDEYRPSRNGRGRPRDTRPGREGTATAETPRPEQGGGTGWPQSKSLCLIPEMYRIALAYGRNPLTGRETDPWRIRNVVRWCRPNPPVGALGDKYRPATSELVVACKSGSRWFDLDAVREAPSEWVQKYGGGQYEANERKDNPNRADRGQRNHEGNPAGAPPLDWWDIPTAPYKGSHYATFPPALVVKPIESMCPRQVCRVCGVARERLTETEQVGATPNGSAVAKGRKKESPAHAMRTTAVVTTLGWSDCGHGDYRPGRVLDPFAGSGTTLAVATGHGRDAIGVDLDARNADLARERVGMWLRDATVEEASAWLAETREPAA